MKKEYQNKTDDLGRIYITQEDIDSLETALGELNEYTYPESEIKNKYGAIANWEDIIIDLDSKLKPIFEKIRKSYMKYLPENERVIQFAPLEEEEEEEEQPVNASVGGRRRKYRKKRTKKRRKSKGRKRRKSRRKKRRKSRRRKRTRKRR